MGISISYCAIPPSSTLYARMQNEEAFSILADTLFYCWGDGLFRCFEAESSEVGREIINETLESMIGYDQDVFGSPEQSAKIITEFRTELDKTRKAYPGIENRTANIGKSSSAIAYHLLEALKTSQIHNAEKIICKLLDGDQLLAPSLFTEEDQTLRLISLDLVHEGASLLRLIDPETLYTEDERWNEWGLKHLKCWRDLCLVADEMNEEILVGMI